MRRGTEMNVTRSIGNAADFEKALESLCAGFRLSLVVLRGDKTL